MHGTWPATSILANPVASRNTRTKLYAERGPFRPSGVPCVSSFQPRRFAITRPTIGLSLVALVLAVLLGLVISQPSSFVRPVTTTVRGTTTLTYTTTSTANRTTTSTVTSLLSSGPFSNTTGTRVYKVTFQQVADCGTHNYMPWEVTLNGVTEVQPSNQSLPLPSDTFSAALVTDQNLTRIVFSVPPGVYSYLVNGGADNFGGGLFPARGIVDVNGSDVTVDLDVYLSITC